LKFRYKVFKYLGTLISAQSPGGPGTEVGAGMDSDQSLGFLLKPEQEPESDFRKKRTRSRSEIFNFYRIRIIAVIKFKVFH